MSTSAAQHLSPAYPGRAPWGTAGALRAWQRAALDDYGQRSPKDYLTVATPGSGKTTFALRAAAELLSQRVVHQVTIVTPTEHLKRQWSEAAARAGINVDPMFTGRRGRTSTDYTGVAVTYAGVATRPMLHRARCENRRTLVILDEIHHAGDSRSWGDALREAFEPATRRLALTGTPFRSDVNPIPFVRYESDPELPGAPQRSVADYTYGYAQALTDGVVRPMLFLAYSGDMRWRTSAGDEVASRLGEPMTKDLTNQAWRTALDPAGEWIPAVLRAADTRLSEVRRNVPDAGGLVIAGDQDKARAYAKILERVSGERPVVVISDEARSSRRIEEFTQGTQRWMVAVRMVSEGVDVPRLAVGVYATPTQTPLFFAQAIGRFVRVRRRGETASIFLPSIPTLLEHASQLETQRDHVLARPARADDDPLALEQSLIDAANREDDSTDPDAQPFEALDSAAQFDRVLYDGGEFGTEAGVGSQEEADYLGIPGLLEPDQVTALLRRHQAQQVSRRDATGAAQQPPSADDQSTNQPTNQSGDRTSVHEQVSLLRRELNGLVGAWHHRTGTPHGVIHRDLRAACGGPSSSLATIEQLQQRIDTIRGWAASR